MGILKISRKEHLDVDEIVAAKALCNVSGPQRSMAWPQRIQYKAVIFTRFQQISIIGENWFGTTGSAPDTPFKMSHLQKVSC
jgi:hypothetical protein